MVPGRRHGKETSTSAQSRRPGVLKRLTNQFFKRHWECRVDATFKSRGGGVCGAPESKLFADRAGVQVACPIQDLKGEGTAERAGQCPITLLRCATI